ncbi:hypothetical protein BofuT4_uP047960.1 [Botrytis cinerea T4]|uniref:Uncharacterized protein n=1 Tax=Botryotinia fuckeliana (strain T4) TaxID=999810 RepID=G2XZ91_BOTF4|nr:hypothetical protein BofuT4_uP047960.1 [Botrytis cinerea T4]
MNKEESVLLNVNNLRILSWPVKFVRLLSFASVTLPSHVMSPAERVKTFTVQSPDAKSQDKIESVFPRNLKFERERQGYGQGCDQDSIYKQ